MKFDILKDIVSQSCYLKSRPDLVILGGGGMGKPKILETLRVEDRMKLDGKISTSPRYMIDITGTDPLSLE